MRAEDPRPVRPRSYRLAVLRGRCRGRGCPRGRGRGAASAGGSRHIGARRRRPRVRARPPPAEGGGGGAVSGSRRSCPGTEPAAPLLRAPPRRQQLRALLVPPVPPGAPRHPGCRSRSTPALPPEPGEGGRKRVTASSVGSVNRRLQFRAAERRFLCLGSSGCFLLGWLAGFFSSSFWHLGELVLRASCANACPWHRQGTAPLGSGFLPLPVLNQRVRNVITASITFKHINLIKHWSDHTHASLLIHAAQISRTIEDIKSYLSTRANLYPAEVSQMSCYAKGLSQMKWCPRLKAGHTKRSAGFW